MAVKYQILFRDRDNNPCKVTFDFADYAGAPINVLSSGDPVAIKYNGDQDDLFQQLVTSQATIKCIAQPDFVRDTRDIDDRDVYVEITTPATKWIGYLITYQRSEKFDSRGYGLEMIAKDPFSYLKENAYQLLANDYVMGLQNMATICQNVIDASHSLPISFVCDYKPVDSDGNTVMLANIFNHIYLRLETFMNEGLLPSGDEIISKICDLFNCTSFVCDETLYFRQPRALISLQAKEIGIIGRNKNYIINDEYLTRTKAYVQLGVKHAYGETGGNIMPNNFFYFLDPNAAKGSEIMHWQYPSSATQEVYRSRIIRDNGKGIFIKGLYEGMEGTWPRDLFMFGLSNFNTDLVQSDPLLNSEYLLRIKYRYHRYALTRTTQPIKYGFRVYAVFSDGSQYGVNYDGDGGRDVSAGNWYGFNLGSICPLITFPLEATGNESTFELKLICKGGTAFPVSKGDYQFLVSLYPISSGATNSSIPDAVIPDDINITECSIEPDIYSMPDFEINRDANPARNRTESALYVADNTNIRSNKRFKEVAETVEVIAGVKTSEAPDAENGNPVQYTLSNLNGSLQLSANQPITKFDRNGYKDKLVTLNAIDRMYFLRRPRNKITLDIRSTDLKFSDILSFPDFVSGKYVQMESEYRVAECEHTITVQELAGDDDENDIIENYLSSE